MALALESTPKHANGSGTSLALPAFSTSQACRLYLAVLWNSDVTVTGITGGSLTWTRRASQDNGSNTRIELWSAPATGAVSSEIYAVNFSGSSSFATADVFAFSGQDTSGTPFDSNASVPAKSATDPVSISTDNADDVIVACFRESSTANPTEGSGFTKISGADYLLTEYKIVAATQSSLSCAQGTGAGDSNGCIADALKAAAGGGGGTAVPVFVHHRKMQGIA